MEAAGEGREEGELRATSLLYHDAIEDGDFRASGFSVPGADHYKLDAAELDEHFDRIADRIDAPPGSVTGDEWTEETGTPLFLTFDDGGASAVRIAQMLDRRGWRGHFLVTTGFVGRAGFVDAADVRALDDAGHVVGSHSHTHMSRMSRRGGPELVAEWRESLDCLAEILGRPVRVASVPFGAYSKRVGAAAAEAGVRRLFTSEPVHRCWRVDDCVVLGRYSVVRGDRAAKAAALASRRASGAQIGQYLTWTGRKVAKGVAYPLYHAMRSRVLEASGS